MWLTYFLATSPGISFASFLATLGISSLFAIIIIGPLAEEFFLFFYYQYEAWDIYRTTSAEEKKKRVFYIKNGFLGWSKSAGAGLVVQDPLYFLCMYLGLRFLPGTPPWVVSFLATSIEVFFSAFLIVIFKELLHFGETLYFSIIGVESEKYYEARFCYFDKEKAESVFQGLIKKYVPDQIAPDRMTFHDRYFTEKKWLNGRKMKLRSRERTDGRGGIIKTWQILFSIPEEDRKQRLEQYRYFILTKHKFYHAVLSNEELRSPKNIKEPRIRNLFSKHSEKKEPTVVHFERFVAQHPASLRIAFDQLPEKNLFFIEIKAHKNRKSMLREAIRFVITHGGLQTTHGKLGFAGGRETWPFSDL
jgi:hypothetical protein